MFLIFLLFVFSALTTIPNANQAQTFINMHNCYRATVDPPARSMPYVYWLGNLSVSSNNWASQCKWGHSGTAGVGENIYATSLRTPNASVFDPRNAVNAWGAEKSAYDYYTNTCATGKICGHYTQIVWAKSTYLGCSFQDCPIIQGLSWPNGGTLVVCQYSPPGNYVGQRPYTAA